ncbi:hypothetical protein DM02DRAFT_662006 [Periconia macrospinosa]|uniref:Uncharacterized protein n=1 Tax=Periconia macrospinosa TaxID=97972 RepID=A0A2V1D5P2_9PLEO|nr:hypothetical protein DM02DRAFT_662006 [Periconia macrospinosa]
MSAPFYSPEDSIRGFREDEETFRKHGKESITPAEPESNKSLTPLEALRYGLDNDDLWNDKEMTLQAKSILYVDACCTDIAKILERSTLKNPSTIQELEDLLMDAYNYYRRTKRAIEEVQKIQASEGKKVDWSKAPEEVRDAAIQRHDQFSGKHQQLRDLAKKAGGRLHCVFDFGNGRFADKRRR